MNNMPDFSAHGYIVEEEIGNYYYENRAIYRACEQRRGLPVILKEYRFFFNESTVKALVQQESDTLQVLAHRGIPRYIDCFVVRDVTSPEVGSIILVLEYKPGSSLEKGFHLSLEQLRHLVLQVLAILSYAQRLDPPIFHRDLNFGDIVVDYLSNGQIEVAVLSFGKVQENAILPTVQEKWQYDLQKLGAIAVRLLIGQATTKDAFSEQSFSLVNQSVNPAFIEGIKRLLGAKEIGYFQNATQAYEYFTTISVLTPLRQRLIPLLTLLECFGITMLLCAMWYGWSLIPSLIYEFGQAFPQIIPVTIKIELTFGQYTEVNVVYLLAGVLFGGGVLLGIACAYLVMLEGVLLGIVLILLATLVLVMYWFVGAMLYRLLLLTPITVTGILLLSFYRFMLRCWRQMRQENFPLFYTGLTMLSAILAAIAITNCALSILFWHRHLVFFVLLSLTTLFLWWYLVNYPTRRYQADLMRQRKAQAFVLKG